MKREQAIKDCQELWKYLSVSGTNKSRAIQKLYEDGILSRKFYYNRCPLCELTDCECISCPWVQSENCKCTNRTSPYVKWEMLLAAKFLRRFRLKRAAKKVYELTLKLK